MNEFVHALAIVGLVFLPIVFLLVWERYVSPHLRCAMRPFSPNQCDFHHILLLGNRRQMQQVRKQAF
jgi:hypothetical protein